MDTSCSVVFIGWCVLTVFWTCRGWPHPLWPLTSVVYWKKTTSWTLLLTSLSRCVALLLLLSETFIFIFNSHCFFSRDKRWCRLIATFSLISPLTLSPHLPPSPSHPHLPTSSTPSSTTSTVPPSVSFPFQTSPIPVPPWPHPLPPVSMWNWLQTPHLQVLMRMISQSCMTDSVVSLHHRREITRSSPWKTGLTRSSWSRQTGLTGSGTRAHPRRVGRGGEGREGWGRVRRGEGGRWWRWCVLMWGVTSRLYINWPPISRSPLSYTGDTHTVWTHKIEF